MRAARRLLAARPPYGAYKQYVEAERRRHANPPESGIAAPLHAGGPVAPTRPAEPVRSESLRGSELPPSEVRRVKASFGSEDLIVDGEVEAPSPARPELTSAKRSCARHIEARNVIVHGRVDGDIHATERVSAQERFPHRRLATARISIEDGAFFKGGIDIRSRRRLNGSSQAQLRSPQLRSPHRFLAGIVAGVKKL